MIVERQVAFSETDASGRVHFSNYLRWVEDAEHQFLRERGVEIFNEDAGWPRVKVSCEYLQPLFFEDDLRIELKLERIGSSSLTFRFEIRKGEQLVATGETVSVQVASGKASQFSDEIRKKLEGEPGA